MKSKAAENTFILISPECFGRVHKFFEKYFYISVLLFSDFQNFLTLVTVTFGGIILITIKILVKCYLCSSFRRVKVTDFYLTQR